MDPQEHSPLLLVKGDATPEEVAALVAVLQAASAGGDGSERPRRRPRPEWAAPHRLVRRPVPGSWRSSSLP